MTFDTTWWWMFRHTVERKIMIMNINSMSKINSIILLFTLLLISTPLGAREYNCGEKRDGYAEIIDVHPATLETAIHQKVMITSQVRTQQLGCTRMLCNDSDPCCNSCFGFLYLNDVKLVSEDDDDLTCTGTNCEMTCGVYRDGDVITVYGEIKGSNMVVDDHCLSSELKE